MIASTGKAKLTTEQVQEIRAMRASGVYMALIAERFGVSRSTISGIATGRCWKHLPTELPIVRDSRITHSLPAAATGRTRAAEARTRQAIERQEMKRLAEEEAKYERAKEEARRGRDPDVRRYRREKSKRQRRVNRILDAAKVEFQLQLERAAAARRPGRPKKNRSIGS